MPAASFMRTEEVAAVLRVDPCTVARWCRSGKIPGAVQPGRHWLIPETYLATLAA